MKGWQYMDRVFSEVEARKLEANFKKQGNDVRVIPQQKKGELLCWDVWIRMIDYKGVKPNGLF